MYWMYYRQKGEMRAAFNYIYITFHDTSSMIVFFTTHGRIHAQSGHSQHEQRDESNAVGIEEAFEYMHFVIGKGD